MSLFRPIRGQYERLARALGAQKTLGLGAAAAAMRVRREQADKSLAVMTRRGYFGADAPYIDNELRLLVRDRRYAGYALLLSALERLRRALDELREALRRRARGDAQAQKEERARAVGSFVRDLMDGASKGGAGQVLRARTGDLVRDLIAPGAQTAAPGDQALTQASAQLAAGAEGMRDYLLSHPEDQYLREDADYIRALCRQIESAAAAPGAAAGERLLREDVPELRRRLDAFFALSDAMPAGDSDPLLNELDAKCDEIRAVGRKIRAQRVRDGISRVNAALYDILAQLKSDPACRQNAAVRSLRACYLPVTRELLEKYAQYEARAVQDAATAAAMERAACMLESDVPAALRQLLVTLRAGQAIELDAQTTALENKLRLDGLL